MKKEICFEAFRWECGNVMMVGHNVKKTMQAYEDILAEGTPDCGAGNDPVAFHRFQNALFF